MKMITAIVNKADADMVCNALAEAGFAFTKMATTGGFLRSGNTTLLMGTEDDKVATALEIIHQHCHKRTVNMPVHTVHDSPQAQLFTPSAPVEVGGATVFVTTVEQFEKY